MGPRIDTFPNLETIEMHVCVLGSGVMGATTAYYLARDGHRVTVLEQHPRAGEEASFANGGQLSYSYVAPLASPSALRHLPAWLVDRNAPLRFVPSLNLDQWRWCAAFLRACNASRSGQTTDELLQLGAYSRSMLHQLIQDEQLEFDFQNSGKLVIFRDPHEFENAQRQMAFQANLGPQQEPFDAAACVAREPALAPLQRRIVGGIYTASEDAGDCHRFSREVARVASERYGATFRYGVSVTGLRAGPARIYCASTAGGDIEADEFVVALGNASRSMLKPLGIDLPLYPLKGYSLTIPVGSAHRAPRISITDLHHKIVYARLGNRLRIAGMVDIAGAGAGAARQAQRLALLARQALETFPEAGDYAQAQTWSGSRPATPDSKPLLGASRFANLWLNTGQGALGFTFACASARLVADALAKSPTALSLDPFSLGERRIVTADRHVM